MPELTGRHAVITGGGKGIGLRVAQLLAAEGALVSLIDKGFPDGPDPSATAAETADVADRQAVENAMAALQNRCGPVDILVSNAGMDILSPGTWNVAPETWHRIVDVNLNGAWWACAAVIPAMIERGYGRIVFIGSNAARLGGFGIGHSPAYSAAKAGLVGLTVALSAQLEGHGIRVNAISAGPTGTSGTPPTPQEREEYLRAHPLGYGTEEPVATAVRYLVTASGDWISGAVMNVSGGEFRGF